MDQLIENILKDLNNRVDYAEVYMEHTKTTDVKILNDKVNYANEEDELGIGIRIIKDQRQGFAYTTNINRINETIDKSINNSKLNDPDENLSIIDNDKEYKKVNGLYDSTLEEVDLQEAIAFSNNLINLVKDRNCNPVSGGYAVDLSTVSIINTNGVNVSEDSTSCVGVIEVNVDDNDVVSSAYYYDASHSAGIDADMIVDKATTLALDSRNAKATTTRNAQVILDYPATVSLLGTFFSALNSENKQRGRSHFANCLGDVVTTENFTLTDDGSIDGALASSSFDAEATPTEKTVLIEDGVLKNFIYDTYHANKEGGDVKTTANAVRSGYSSVPTVGFTNLLLDFKDMTTVEDICDGIMVNSVMGAHTANPITGDFSVEALNAFEIKNGSIQNPIKKVMISGNIFDIMKTATKATEETRQLGSCITPKITCENLRIIG